MMFAREVAVIGEAARRQILARRNEQAALSYIRASRPVRHPGGCGAGELGRHLDVSVSTARRILASLRRRGLIEPAPAKPGFYRAVDLT